MSAHILAVVPSDWHGVRRALACYATHISTPERAITTIDALRPKTVIFGCYQRDWYNIVAQARFHRSRCVVAWFASPILNEFDSRNREWLYASLQSIRRGHMYDIHELAIPHNGLASFWREEGIPARYLPLTFTAPPKMGIPMSDDVIHLGLFGSGQPWKNTEIQAFAAQILHRRHKNVMLHVQNDRAVRSAQRFFDIPITVHRNTMTDDEYYQLIGSVHVNLIMSLSETYSYLGAESLALGVPILTTPITPILATAPSHLRGPCVLDTFDDPMVIADRVEYILKHRASISELGQVHIHAFNEVEQAKVAKVRDEWLLPLSS